MIREIVQMAKSAPITGSAKAFIIDEVHTLQRLSQEGLLKDTEEPQKHTYYFLCTTEPQKIWEVLRDRCFELEMKRLGTKESGRMMAILCNEEDIEFTPKILKEILRYAEGIPRRILKGLYYAKSVDASSELKEILGTVDLEDPEIVDLCRFLTYGKNVDTLKIISTVKDKDAEGVRKAVLSYLQKAILDPRNKNKVIDLLSIVEEFKQPFYNGTIDLIYAVFASVS
jgi:DNA polymerase III gamma/tau subunit